MFEFGIQLGEIKVHVGKPGKGMTPEFWAEQATDRIMSVAATVPEPIRQQAQAFKDEIGRVVLQAVRQAVLEERAMNALKVEAISAEAAQVIRGGH